MRVLPAAITAIAVIWLVALFAAPSGLARGRFPVATFLVYEAGSHICHQRRERSFEWLGVQMPVCSRCLGLYVAGAIGALAGLLTGSKSNAVIPARRAVAVATVPMLLSLALEWTGVASGSNATRFASSVPLGGILGLILVRQLTEGTEDTEQASTRRLRDRA